MTDGRFIVIVNRTPYRDPFVDCPTCGGSGSVPPWMGDGVFRDGGASCPDCELAGISHNGQVPESIARAIVAKAIAPGFLP